MDEIRFKYDEAISWCLKNNIIIYTQPINRTELKIIIKKQSKKPIVGEIVYKAKPTDKDENWSDKIRELYLHYYNNRPKTK